MINCYFLIISSNHNSSLLRNCLRTSSLWGYFMREFRKLAAFSNGKCNPSFLGFRMQFYSTTDKIIECCLSPSFRILCWFRFQWQRSYRVLSLWSPSVALYFRLAETKLVNFPNFLSMISRFPFWKCIWSLYLSLFPFL